VPDFDEARRQHMLEIPVNELDSVERHHLLCVTVGRIPPAKTYFAILAGDQSSTSKCNSMRVAGQILQNVLRTAEWTSGIHDPVDSLEFVHEAIEFAGVSELSKRAAKT